MSSKYSETEQTLDEAKLRQQVEQSERALNDFDRDLQAVDAELDVLAQKNQQYDVLSQVCDSLQELDGLGAAHLFWGKQDDGELPLQRLRNAQREIDDFSEQVARVQDRRLSVVEKMDDQNQALDYLHFDLLDAIEREEQRKNAWLIERDANETAYHAQVMPWARGGEEDQRFRKSLGRQVEDRKRIVDATAANLIRNEPSLLCAYTVVTQTGYRFHISASSLSCRWSGR